MEHDFPGAVPEIPVSDVDTAAAYYKNQLGFSIDWSSGDGGIAGISKGSCRMFLTNRAFREHYGNAAPRGAAQFLLGPWVSGGPPNYQLKLSSRLAALARVQSCSCALLQGQRGRCAGSRLNLAR